MMTALDMPIYADNSVDELSAFSCWSLQLQILPHELTFTFVVTIMVTTKGWFRCESAAAFQ